MKKLLSMVMAVSLMTGAVALGEVGFAVQNEQPPTLVTAQNAQGQTITGMVYNDQGEAAEILDDGSLILTDVHDRSNAQKEEISQRLTSAFEDVMDDVHHSDVACELHDHDVKVDINMVLSSLNHEMNAHDLVMYEMFDLDFDEEIKALIGENGYVEVTLEIDAHQPLPLVVLYSKDGANWTVIPYTPAGENKMTLQLPASGTLALLADGAEIMGVGVQNETAVGSGEIIYEETLLPNFTPSVSGKLSPNLVTRYAESGEPYVGMISGVEGEEGIRVPDTNYIWVTATAERDFNYDVQTHEHLEWAFDSILHAENVGELPSDSEDGTIAAALNETLAQMGLDLTPDQLVVKDLFEVTAYGDYVHYLYDEDHYVEMTFETDLDPEQPAIVLHSKDSVHWHIHPIEEAEVHEDGTITLRMYDLGAVAILVENQQLPLADGEMVTAP